MVSGIRKGCFHLPISNYEGRVRFITDASVASSDRVSGISASLVTNRIIAKASTDVLKGHSLLNNLVIVSQSS